MHIGWFDSYAAHGTAKITDLKLCLSECMCEYVTEESAVAAQVIHQSQLKVLGSGILVPPDRCHLMEDQADYISLIQKAAYGIWALEQSYQWL